MLASVSYRACLYLSPAKAQSERTDFLGLQFTCPQSTARVWKPIGDLRGDRSSLPCAQYALFHCFPEALIACLKPLAVRRESVWGPYRHCPFFPALPELTPSGRLSGSLPHPCPFSPRASSPLSHPSPPCPMSTAQPPGALCVNGVPSASPSLLLEGRAAPGGVKWEKDDEGFPLGLPLFLPKYLFFFSFMYLAPPELVSCQNIS